MNIRQQLPKYGWPMLFIIILLPIKIDFAPAAIITNIANSKHNLSASGTGTVKADSESQICVFCHTPHNPNITVIPPLWNRELSSLTYVTYSSASMDAVTDQPGGTSKLCLSCHDGTLALGTVGVLNGVGPTNIALSGTNAGVIPSGLGEQTGYTRNIGIDLSNDHPISFTYDSALANMDGELRVPPYSDGTTPILGNRVAGVVPRPVFPLDNDQMQCTTCHDPHNSESDIISYGSSKFLRGSRLQRSQPLGGAYVLNTDSMCLACHEKGADLWAYSAHSNVNVADEYYLDAPAAEREFPLNTQVWQAGCLNCHDAHTTQGAKQLLRDGTDSTAIPKSGGNSASEETCYQCHSGVDSILTTTINVPDIKTDANLPIHLPLSKQPESHAIGGNFNDNMYGGNAVNCSTSASQCGKDFIESQAALGNTYAGGFPSDRHAECSDCHNPHRVTKNRLFNDNPSTEAAAGTHKHTLTATDTEIHSNIASGSLRGSFGVEPTTYLSNEFGVHPLSYDAKRGDLGNNVPNLVSSSYVTREYQICFKCHSTYAYDSLDPNALPLGYSGGTTQGINGLLYYADNAMEFHAPVTHQGSPQSTSDSGASLSYSTNNHRSWHPVMDKTDRTAAVRNGDSNLWRSPWNGSDTDGGPMITVTEPVGNQTMFCSDCHGSSTNPGDGVVPVGGEDGNAWGPHGSTENFLLKGAWNTGADHTGPDTVCFRCHELTQYADTTGAPASVLPSGFGGPDPLNPGVPFLNLHQRHAYFATLPGSTWPASENNTYRCTVCHTGTAHGWKNKEFLVNLNDLGPEISAYGGEDAGGSILSVGQSVPKGTVAPTTTFPNGYSNGPYYRGAFLRISSFAPSGQWDKTNCTGGCH